MVVPIIHSASLPKALDNTTQLHDFSKINTDMDSLVGLIDHQFH